MILPRDRALLRRNPFADRDARRTRRGDTEPEQQPGSINADTRARTDPRRRKLAATVGRVGANARICWRQAAADHRAHFDEISGVRTVSREASDATAFVRIENPVSIIAVVPDLPGGQLSSHDRDVLGAATAVAENHEGAAVLCVVFGDCAVDLADVRVDRAVHLKDTSFKKYSVETKLAALLAIDAQYKPRHWLFPDSRLGSGEMGRRLAARLRASVATDILRLEGDRVARRAKSGTCEQIVAVPTIMLMAEESAELEAGPRHEARVLTVTPYSAPRERVREVEVRKGDPTMVPLEEASFVIAGGSGIRDWTLFHQLARDLGASEGGSRVAVDAGMMPRARQIGASGTAISARVYFAIGISGAPQHLQGIQRCEKVIAINPDPNCDMVKRADIAIVADAHPVMDSLASMARELRVRG